MNRCIPIFITIFGYNVTSAQISFEIAFEALSFDQAVEMQASNDGSDRIFIVEQPGLIKVFPNNPEVLSNEVSTFLDIQDSVFYGEG